MSFMIAAATVISQYKRKVKEKGRIVKYDLFSPVKVNAELWQNELLASAKIVSHVSRQTSINEWIDTRIIVDSG